jgi:hypothetical protein
MRHSLNIVVATALLAMAGTAALAQNQQQPAPAQSGAAETQPIPTLHCEFPTMHSCTKDGACKTGGEATGSRLPLKVTVDFENSVVASADEAGFPRSDKIDAIASSSGQLVMHGIDGPFSWQMLIHDGSEIAALSFASSDATISAFGTCKQ